MTNPAQGGSGSGAAVTSKEVLAFVESDYKDSWVFWSDERAVVEEWVDNGGEPSEALLEHLKDVAVRSSSHRKKWSTAKIKEELLENLGDGDQFEDRAQALGEFLLSGDLPSGAAALVTLAKMPGVGHVEVIEYEIRY